MMMGLIEGPVPAAGGGDAAATTAFLARTFSLDATHTNAYKALINGLVADGVFAKLDVLYIFATQTRANALLNLCSSSFNITDPGGATFTADAGFTSANISNVLNTNFNASTAGGNFTQNSAHLMVWDSTSGIGDSNAGVGASSNQHIYQRFGDGNAYFRINSSSSGVAVANAHGFYIGNRSGSSAWQGYKNGSSITSGTDASGAPGNANLTFAASASSGESGTADQLSAGGAGGSLSSTDVGNYYSRMSTFMTTVGLSPNP